MAAATAVRAPYNLVGDNLDVTVTQPSSPVTGAKKFVVSFSYTPPNFLSFLGIGAPTQTFSQTVFVPT